MNNKLTEKLKNLAKQNMTDTERCRQILELAEEVDDSSVDDLYLTIVHKLAQEYFQIFYVDIKTNKFLAYDPFDPNKTFEEKEDFFMEQSKNDFPTLYHEDVDSFFSAFKKDKIIQSINDLGSSHLSIV